MALFLSQEQMWDRPLGGSGTEKQIPHWCGNIIYVVLGFICKLLFRYRVIGRQNLRAFDNRQGCVVVGNHTSFLDVVFMYLSIRPGQWVRLMGRDSLFSNNELFGQILTRVGGFPVKRDSADRGALKRAARMLKNGELVGIYPEGTRRGKGSQVPSLHAGAALVARMGKSPLIPMTVRNVDKVKVKGQARVHFPTITVEFGTPVSLDDFSFLPKDEQLEACTWYVMRECFALSLQIPAAEVNMPALFPETKDYAEVFEQHSIPPYDLQSSFTPKGE